MIFYQARTPEEYQDFFYRQIGLRCQKCCSSWAVWEDEKVGFVKSFGRMDQIMVSAGNYTIPSDFLVEYQYDSIYLHFGIIFEGITYSVVEEGLVPMAIPSSFLAVEKASGGVNRWKKGQHCNGVELSIDFRYLNAVLLPVLGIAPEELSFLKENVRYMSLPDEMKSLLLRSQQLLGRSAMTPALLLAFSLELIALVLHPDHRTAFFCQEASASRTIRIGQRSIRLTREDLDKIMQAHELIENSASSFPTSYTLAHTLQISEQKLKAGFFDLYQQTIWDFSNSVRMNTAVELLLGTEKTVSEISQQTGYQSQTAFNTMFKKWSGVTPRQFRLQVSERTNTGTSTGGSEKR